MEKRYQVFVSSTFEDLREERQEVMQALLEMSGIPAGMEIWPSTSDDSWTLIQRMISESDYYLVVVAGRYGSTDAAGVSFTEREYDYAVSLNKPVLAFVHADPKRIASGHVDDEATKRLALEAFRARLRNSRFCRPWTERKELGGLVSRAFASIKNTHPTPGWIHASTSVDPLVLVELGRSRERVRELEEELRTARYAAPEESKSLRSGRDETKVEYSGIGVADGDKERISGTVKFSWDQLFAMVGPDMFEPLREDYFRARILNGVAASVVRKKRLDVINDPSIAHADFQRIKVQLRALGLIERAARPEEKGGATYWKLTPYGDVHLTQLLAERR